MKFKNFQLIIDQKEPLRDDIIKISEQGLGIVKDYSSDWYEIKKEFIENRFLWIYCQYNNANIYREVVLDGDHDIERKNPRTKNQVELHKQVFFCYDCKTNLFYTDNLEKRGFIKYYFKDTLQKDIILKNVYASLDDFQEKVKAITGFKFIQMRNIANLLDDSIFQKQANIFGLDLPEKISMSVDYGLKPIGAIKGLLQNFKHWHDIGSFEKILLIGVDDNEVEQTFDFSSLMQHIELSVKKDDNERYDAEEVRVEFLNNIR